MTDKKEFASTFSLTDEIAEIITIYKKGEDSTKQGSLE